MHTPKLILFSYLSDNLAEDRNLGSKYSQLQTMLKALLVFSVTSKKSDVILILIPLHIAYFSLEEFKIFF